jgi:CRP-like cAMP-binding protein
VRKLNFRKIIKTDKEFHNIFKNMPDSVADKWELKEYAAGEIICHQGEISDYFYYILEGYLSIYLMAENGSKYVQSIYKRGNYFGELEIFNQHPYVCTVETISYSKIIRLQRKYFMQWLQEDHDYLFYLTRTLCDSFYQLSRKAGEDLLYSLNYRICNYLVYQAETASTTAGKFRLELDKKQLSDQLAVTKRSINRVLKNLSQKRILELSSKSIIIRDLKALKQEEKLSRDQ